MYKSSGIVLHIRAHSLLFSLIYKALLVSFFLFFSGDIFIFLFYFFIVVQVQLYPFSPHHSLHPSHPHFSPFILVFTLPYQRALEKNKSRKSKSFVVGMWAYSSSSLHYTWRNNKILSIMRVVKSSQPWLTYLFMLLSNGHTLHHCFSRVGVNFVLLFPSFLYN